MRALIFAPLALAWSSVAAAAPSVSAVKLSEGLVVPAPKPTEKHQPPMRTTLLLDEQSGAQKASLSLLYISPKARVAMQRLPRSARLLYVLEGKGRILAPGVPPGELGPGTAVYVKPGAAHAFDVQSPQKPLRLLQVFAPLGPERVFRDPSKREDYEVIRGKPEATEQPFLIVHPADVKALPLSGGKGKVQIMLDPQKTGGRQAYLGVLELEAGAAVGEHKHAAEAEILFVAEGEAELVSGGVTLRAERDTALHVPVGVPHAGRTAKGARIIQIYAPGGPEQRFKK